MRGKFFFVVFGLCFFVGCTGTAYLEIKNSSGRDIDLEIYAFMTDESNLVPEGETQVIAIKKDETVTKELEFTVVRGGLDPNKHIALGISEKGDDSSLAGYRIHNNQTQKVEIISRQKACPEPKLAGKWVISEINYYFIFNSENNKCERNRNKDKNDILEWDYKDGKLFYREWRTKLVIVDSETEREFISLACKIYNDKIEIGLDTYYRQ